MAVLKDSGERREFETGAVRDIQEGKGRCDLLPFTAINMYLDRLSHSIKNEDNTRLKLLYALSIDIENYMYNGNCESLYHAIKQFINFRWNGDIYTALLELSKHYEDGAVKYGDRNWEQGIPCHCYIDSAYRHLLKFCRGDEDEPHDRAFLWNICGLIWTIEHRKDCMDIPFYIDRREKKNDQKTS